MGVVDPTHSLLSATRCRPSHNHRWDSLTASGSPLVETKLVAATQPIFPTTVTL